VRGKQKPTVSFNFLFAETAILGRCGLLLVLLQGRCVTGRRKKFLCIFPIRPSAACHSLQFYNLFERATHAMKTISAVRSGKKDNKDICLLFFFGQQ
jgi:hypothetical protein